MAARDALKSVVVVHVDSAGAGAGSAAATIAAIASNSLSCAAILVVSDATDLDRDACSAAADGIALSFVSPADRLAAVRTAVNATGAVGALFVSAGMSVPYAFDVRLARISMQDPAVGTVSPFCNLSPVHRLHDLHVHEAPRAEDVSRLDRLAFLTGSRSYFEVPEALAECCFMSAATIERPSHDLLHVLSDSVFVGTLPSVRIAAKVKAAPSQSPQLERSRQAIVEADRAGVVFNGAPGLDGRPVQLHVTHDLGGGTQKWLRDFGRADSSRTNMVLRAMTHGQEMGTGLALFTDVMDEVPLRAWNFSSRIQATVPSHLEYRRIVDEITREHCVDVVLVSSLIGHSLDILATGLPTVVVTHDYYPYCPAINIYFGEVCRQCDGQRIDECYRKNPHYNPFVTFLPPERIRVRERFMELVRRPNVTLATPSRSVAENLTHLNPLFTDVSFATIPHAYGDPLKKIPGPAPGADERLRILVLGQLSKLKGVDLLRGALSALGRFADIWLVGAREVGEAFKFDKSVHVISEYELEDLPVHVKNINPHVALLTSIVPETFNYVLSELMMLGVPVAATRVGSFVERIRPGENGYLFDPDVPSLVRAMGEIDADRETLARIRGNLEGYEAGAPAEMVAAYHRITPVEPASFARYPLGRPLPESAVAPDASSDRTRIAQATLLSSMWKDVKSLHTELGIVSRARLAELAESEKKSRQLAAAEKRIQQQEAQLGEKDMHIQGLTSHLEMKSGQVAEMLASTSWRISAPVRWLGRAVLAAKSLARHLVTFFGDSASLPENMRIVTKAWRSGGVPEVRRALRELRSAESRGRAWEGYGRAFRKEVRPRIVARIAEMPVRPLISVLVPVYNPNQDMLRQMLDSVRTQLYPNWELCIVDDASTEPHVASELKGYEKHEKRIKLRLEPENHGVSHALNTALEMARGDFVVLLDHDDVLEENALFRFAESIVEDDPDLVYGDEALVEASGAEVMRFAHRPAFSPEFLRSHPYIVHPVGFRTKLLRDVGGFDPNLRISQDYDLILRVVEKARKIVHIPEILYRWRIHGASAGLQKMHEVMEVSKEVLQRHLDRSGDTGEVRDGPSFNLFDVRYPLQDGLSVAIVIPTKNHGDLLRTCIESIWATVSGVRYEIVVIDHESDDQDTIDYLDSIASSVRILRYQGPFNFSAINNWAIAQLGGAHTHYLLCNNDIEAFEAGWLGRMLELAQQPSIGIVGAKLLYPDRKTIQHAGVCVGAFGAAEHYGKRVSSPEQVEPGFSELLAVNHEVAAVTAACMLIRRDAFEEVAGFDEAIAVGFGDVDLCLRVGERGYRVVFCPYAELLHHESYTRGTSRTDPHPEDSALFRFKWKKLLDAGDPFYSPALSLTSTAWALKLPMPCGYSIRRRIVARDPKTGRETISFSPTAR